EGGQRISFGPDRTSPLRFPGPWKLSSLYSTQPRSLLNKTTFKQLLLSRPSVIPALCWCCCIPGSKLDSSPIIPPLHLGIALCAQAFTFQLQPLCHCQSQLTATG
uniref:Uncharacterized protein n=1 Tax=Chelonoidis abingdonii TaxID=106734 RepID=A0A8C0HHG0_CHEAB